MILHLTSIALFIWIMSACSQRPGIERSLEPSKTYYADKENGGYSFSRNILGEVYTVPLSDDRLKYILKKKPFALPGIKSRKTRVPNFEFFHVIIQNSGRDPLYLISPILKYSGIEQHPVSYENFRSKTRSPAYRRINTEALFSKRRLLAAPESPAEIDYNKMTEKTELEFIPPGETVIIPLIFKWVPPEHRSLSLSFTLSAGDKTRPVEHQFDRREYRTRGKHFRDTEK